MRPVLDRQVGAVLCADPYPVPPRLFALAAAVFTKGQQRACCDTCVQPRSASLPLLLPTEAANGQLTRVETTLATLSGGAYTFKPHGLDPGNWLTI